MTRALLNLIDGSLLFFALIGVVTVIGWTISLGTALIAPLLEPQTWSTIATMLPVLLTGILVGIASTIAFAAEATSESDSDLDDDVDEVTDG